MIIGNMIFLGLFALAMAFSLVVVWRLTNHLFTTGDGDLLEPSVRIYRPTRTPDRYVRETVEINAGGVPQSFRTVSVRLRDEEGNSGTLLCNVFLN